MQRRAQIIAGLASRNDKSLAESVFEEPRKLPERDRYHSGIRTPGCVSALGNAHRRRVQNSSAVTYLTDTCMQAQWATLRKACARSSKERLAYTWHATTRENLVPT